MKVIDENPVKIPKCVKNRRFLISALVLLCLLCTACAGNQTGDTVCSHLNRVWIVDREATAERTGVRHLQCSACGESLWIEDIPVTGCSHGNTKWITEKEAKPWEIGRRREVCTFCGETVKLEEIKYALEKLGECYGVSTIRNQNGMYLVCDEENLFMDSKPGKWKIETCGGDRFYLKHTKGFYMMEYFGGIVKMAEDSGYTEQHWKLIRTEEGAVLIEHGDSPDYYLRLDSEGKLSVVNRRDADEGCLWYIEQDNLTPGTPYIEIHSPQDLVVLRLAPEVQEVISLERLQKWADDLELAYRAYEELTGWAYYDQIEVRGYTDCGGWGYIYSWKPVIHVNKDCMYEDLEKMSKRENDWNFGVLHEMSHMFDKPTWDFDPEAMANFKLGYILYKYNATAAPAEFPAEIVYSHDTLREGYRILDGTLGETYGTSRTAAVKQVSAKFLEVAETIGWDAYVYAFNNFPEIADASDLEQFHVLIDLLDQYSSADVRGLFSDREWVELEKTLQ